MLWKLLHQCHVTVGAVGKPEAIFGAAIRTVHGRKISRSGIRSASYLMEIQGRKPRETPGTDETFSAIFPAHESNGVSSIRRYFDTRDAVPYGA